MKPLNLNALDEPRTIEWNGQTYHVRPVTPRTASMIDAATDATDAVQKMVGYYDAVALLVPMMARHDVDSLSVPQIQAIIALAGEQVAAVQAAQDAVADPNAESSAQTTATEPAPAT